MGDARTPAASRGASFGVFAFDENAVDVKRAELAKIEGKVTVAKERLRATEEAALAAAAAAATTRTPTSNGGSRELPGASLPTPRTRARTARARAVARTRARRHGEEPGRGWGRAAKEPGVGNQKTRRRHGSRARARRAEAEASAENDERSDEGARRGTGSPPSAGGYGDGDAPRHARGDDSIPTSGGMCRLLSRTSELFTTARCHPAARAASPRRVSCHP